MGGRWGCPPINSKFRATGQKCNSLTFRDGVGSQRGSFSQLPLVGLTSARALPPTQPGLHSSTSALTSRARPSPTLGTRSGSATPLQTRPHPEVQLARSPAPGPRPNPGASQLLLPGRSPPGPAPRPGHPAVTSWSRPPYASAAQPIGGCHTAGPSRAGVGTSGCRSAWARRVSTGCRVRGCRSRFRRPRRVPTLRRPLRTSPRRHAPPPPCTVSGRGAAAHRGPLCWCLGRAGTHGR